MPQNDEFGVRDRPHVSIDKLRSNETYKFKGQARNRQPMRSDYATHAASLLSQLDRALPPPTRAGTHLTVSGLKPGAVIGMATMPPAKGARTNAVKLPRGIDGHDIVVLRSERKDDRTESALVFVPDDARTNLRQSIQTYGGAPGENPRFEAIETIRATTPGDLFVGTVDMANPTQTWWEIWVPGNTAFAGAVAATARAETLDVHSDRLSFPDTTVLFVRASAAEVIRFAARVPGAIAEIRPATGTIEPFLERGGSKTVQHDWVADLARRIVAPDDDAPVVCTLDTGVSAGHALIAPGLRGSWAYDAAWGTDDHARDGGHGTGMAGLVLYGDLESLMAGSQSVHLTHAVESMKLLPPRGFPPTQPPSYGIVTKGAVALVETEKPGTGRSFCLATSTDEFPPDRPSTWSSALDQIASGAMLGDCVDGVPASRRPKRLLLVATGNVQGGHRDEVLRSQPLEDPSQSWNSLTIGGFTRKDTPPEADPELVPVVCANHRSPYSRGSRGLPTDLTPIKPEVLFEAGNMVSDPSGHCDWHAAVSLLAAGSEHTQEPLIPFWATSAAAGVAGNFIGRLHAAHPGIWPETLRALMVDSARWPQPISRRLIGTGAHWTTTSTKSEKQTLLREVGYGVPDIERAIMSARNDVTLVAQAEIQPFELTRRGGQATFKDMHVYGLPWPRATLQEMDQAVVTMKVTLSYFIEPNLTGRAGTRPDTYRSFGLRFGMKMRTETSAAFRARISATQERAPREAAKEDSYWLLGPRAVQAGSLQCDLWRGHAVDLAGHDMIAVYPVGGWWKSHPGQLRTDDMARYALVVSLSAPDQKVDLHAEISTEILNLVNAGQVQT